MVRVWLVPPECLDDQRLLGEHLEIHIIIGAIAKRHQGKKGGWVNHPETIRYENRVKALIKRHQKLIEEMKKRGWNAGKIHKTPLPTKGIPKSAFKDFKPTKQMILKDISDLKKRWKKEGKKGGRVPLSSYNAPDGQ
ncbi:MAG: pyrimidine dimer DNA glycosylase/endonuclease V [Candidatus Woesearchaeota archaeon]